MFFDSNGQRLIFIERLVVEIAQMMKIDHEAIRLILQKETVMSKEMDDLIAEVAQDTDVESKAITVLQGLETQIANAGTDPVKLQQVISNLSGARLALAAEIAKDTAPAGGGNGTAPVIASIAPLSGSINGGDSIVLTGTGFTGATGVSFGSNPATSFNVDSDTSLTAVSPAGTVGPNGVVVTGLNGVSAPANFVYA